MGQTCRASGGRLVRASLRLILADFGPNGGQIFQPAPRGEFPRNTTGLFQRSASGSRLREYLQLTFPLTCTITRIRLRNTGYVDMEQVRTWDSRSIDSASSALGTK